MYIILYIIMNAISYTYARENLAKTMEDACENHDPVIITRQQSDAVVLMSLEDFESMQETAYLLRSPKNAKRLLESILELQEGKSQERDLIE